MRALKSLSFCLLISLLLFLSACESIWTLPSLVPCERATLCEINANSSLVYVLEKSRVGHHAAIINVLSNEQRILVTGGTSQQDTVLFLNLESIRVDDNGAPSGEGESSFTDSRSTLHFPFNTVVSDLQSKKTYVAGGINSELITLDFPFNMNEIDVSQTSNRLSIYNGNNVDNVWRLDSLDTARAGHTATLLSSRDEIVLIGGNPTEETAEIYNINTSSSIFSAETMTVNRCFHTATFLESQEVLLVGGMAYSDGEITNVIETYNIEGKSFEKESISGSDFAARMGHTANRIGEGKVVIIGGQNEITFHDEAFIYNPAENIMEKVDSLPIPMAYHTATNLPNGWILITGGRSVNSAQNSLLIFKPVEEEFLTLDCTLDHARYGHTTTLVDEDDLTAVKLLVIGGRNVSGAVLQSEKVTLNLNCLGL